MKIKGKRILSNGTFAGYVLQKDKTWRWQFLKKSQSGGASSKSKSSTSKSAKRRARKAKAREAAASRTANTPELREQLGLPPKQRKKRYKSDPPMWDHTECDPSCRGMEPRLYIEGDGSDAVITKEIPCIRDEQDKSWMKIDEYWYNVCTDVLQREEPHIGTAAIERAAYNKALKDLPKDITDFQEGKTIFISASNSILFNSMYKTNNSMSGLRIENYGGGGDCLFRSIAGCIHNKLSISGDDAMDFVNDNHMFIRKTIVEKLREICSKGIEELKKYNITFPLSDAYGKEYQFDKWNEYCNEMDKRSIWGTDLEIRLASLINWNHWNQDGMRNQGVRHRPALFLDIFIFDRTVGTDRLSVIGTEGKSESIAFSQAFINRKNNNYIMIFNTGRVGSESHSGCHYQGIIPRVQTNHKCPIINWGILSGDSTPDRPHPAAHRPHPAAAAPGVPVPHRVSTNSSKTFNNNISRGRTNTNAAMRRNAASLSAMTSNVANIDTLKEQLIQYQKNLINIQNQIRANEEAIKMPNTNINKYLRNKEKIKGREISELEGHIAEIEGQVEELRKYEQIQTNKELAMSLGINTHKKKSKSKKSKKSKKSIGR